MIVLDQTKIDRVPIKDISKGECFKCFTDNTERIFIKTNGTRISLEGIKETVVLDASRGNVYHLDEDILVTPVKGTLTIEPYVR